MPAHTRIYVKWLINQNHVSMMITNCMERRIRDWGIMPSLNRCNNPCQNIIDKTVQINSSTTKFLTTPYCRLTWVTLPHNLIISETTIPITKRHVLLAIRNSTTNSNRVLEHADVFKDKQKQTAQMETCAQVRSACLSSTKAHALLAI